MYYPAKPYPLIHPPYNQPMYHQPSCRYHLSQPYIPYRKQQFPDVDPTLFYKSAEKFKKLLNDASFILNKLAKNEEFAYKVMDAAQKNNLEQVEKLIQSTGVTGDVEISYNPDGINLKMSSQVEGTDCCKLEMAIRWR